MCVSLDPIRKLTTNKITRNGRKNLIINEHIQSSPTYLSIDDDNTKASGFWLLSITMIVIVNMVG